MLAYLYMLVQILNEGNYRSLHWNEDGTEVVIENPADVSKEVLAHNFDTTKYLSFTRQLHLYGFRRITDGRKVRQLKGFCKWSHPNFRRGHPHLLERMSRYQVPKYPSGNLGLGSAKTMPKNLRRKPSAKAGESSKPASVPKTMASHSQATPRHSAAYESPPCAAIASNALLGANVEDFETPPARDALQALQKLVDIVETLSPDVLAFVRRQLDSVGGAIDRILANSTGHLQSRQSVSELSPMHASQSPDALQQPQQSAFVYSADSISNTTACNDSVASGQAESMHMSQSFNNTGAPHASLLPRALSVVYPNPTAAVPLISTSSGLPRLITSSSLLSQHQHRYVNSDSMRGKLPPLITVPADIGLMCTTAVPALMQQYSALSTPPDSTSRGFINDLSPITSFGTIGSPYMNIGQISATAGPITASAAAAIINPSGYALGYPTSPDAPQLGSLEAQLLAATAAPNTPFVNACNPSAGWVANAPAGSSELAVATTSSSPGTVPSNVFSPR
ncbi:hypothetical protein GGI12_003567 [Dipsacomyces acuminosporus]|nr:hypothetical protein GGI12_003567 [Dipsacomyces acuminosporus]